MAQSPTHRDNGQKQDFDYSRDTYYELLEKGKEALEDMINVARESEHPRAYEVLSGMIKNISDVNDRLLILNKGKKDLEKKNEATEVNNTQNNITTYGKLINNNLIGGTLEEEEELESSTEEDEPIEDEEIENEENNEVIQEENIDKQIEKVIQEEIILNKDKYDENLKEARKLGAKQYKMNSKLSKAKKELETHTNNYKKSEEDFNKIMKEVGKFDTNKDGVINFEDDEPTPEELIEEEINMEDIEEEMNKNMEDLKTIGGDFNKLVSMKKIKGGEGENMELVYNIEGYDNNEYSNL